MSEWAVKLFKKSIVKQVKYKQVIRFLGDYANKRCLDIGSDNGVISYLLRQNGGTWSSADSGEDTLSSIKELVATSVNDVAEISDFYKEEEFDIIAIVDMLEHLDDDVAFVRLLKSKLKTDGFIVANVPLKRKKSVLKFLQNRIGLTDEEHGHVREGYTLDELKDLFAAADLKICSAKYYHKFFLECIDLSIRFSMKCLGTKKSTAKGVVVTQSDINKNKKLFSLFSLAYPVLLCVSKLDSLLFCSKGFRLMVKAEYN